MPHADLTTIRDNIIRLLARRGDQVKSAVLHRAFWRSKRSLVERALAFLEADELIGAGKLRLGARGPLTQYFWLTDKGTIRADELNHKED